MSLFRNILSLSAIQKILSRFFVIVLLFGCEPFEPLRMKPVQVETGSVTNVSYTSCSVQGAIISINERGIDQHGFCWALIQNPTTANDTIQLGSKSSTGNFSSVLTGLSANTTYYVRSYAINKAGTTYGGQVSFTTTSYGQLTDIEGNIYNTVIIGTQTWMAENLKTTKYNDDTNIPLVTDYTWGYLLTPGYCWYNNDEASYKNTYGALYNWYTINTGKLCPAGWHVPTRSEWETLINYLGGEIVAGGKLKESGTIHWADPNIGATNVSGFTALPGGSRHYGSNNICFDFSYRGQWWTSTEHPSPTVAKYVILSYQYSDIFPFFDTNKSCGLSIRCIKD